MAAAKKDVVRFTVRWTGTQKAHLLYLIDNGAPIVGPADDETRRSSITVEYEVSTWPSRHFEWSIWFAGKALSDLVAVVTINGGIEQELDDTDEIENRWVSEGNAQRKVA